MSDDDVSRFSKEWVRENWDDERDTGSPTVQLVKAVHEIHIVVPGLVAAAIICPTLWFYDAPMLRIVTAGFGAIGAGYGLFFTQWWCSTLSAPDAD